MPKRIRTSLAARAGRELRALIEAVVCWFPGASGYRIRAWYYRSQFRALGERAVLGLGLLVSGPRQIQIGSGFSCWRFCTVAACEDGAIRIGNNVSLNANVYLNACSRGRLTLGDNVLIGPNVVMRTSDHRFDVLDVPIREQGHTASEIVIEEDVWLGANVTVVGGVRIGRGAVVAAGAVVTRHVAPFTIVGGVPARLIRSRLPESVSSSI